MAVGWGGADPVQVADGSDYELGVEYAAVEDLTITHVRVWAGVGELGFSGRKGRIWTTAGGQLGIATLPDTLPVGWSQHALDEPVVRAAGQHWVVSYSTNGNYGALPNALDGPVESPDGAVTAVAGGSGAHGNGSFEGTPGLFPTTPSGSNAFYGVDTVHELGIGGNTAPSITQLTATPDGAVVTAIVVATDTETMVGASYRYTWGDGSSDTVTTSATAQHTYTASGLYAVLVTVTDAGGLADHAAVPVYVAVPLAGVLGLRGGEIINRVLSHLMALGVFERVNGHEPKSAPSSVGLTAAVWAETIVPAPSGLNVTSARLVLNVRLYTSMLAEPADAIDPQLLAATDQVMAVLSGDFTLGGLVRCIELLPTAGSPGLSARAGYIPQDGRLFRCMTVTVPVIINDAWEQVA